MQRYLKDPKLWGIAILLTMGYAGLRSSTVCHDTACASASAKSKPRGSSFEGLQLEAIIAVQRSANDPEPKGCIAMKLGDLSLSLSAPARSSSSSSSSSSSHARTHTHTAHYFYNTRVSSSRVIAGCYTLS